MRRRRPVALAAELGLNTLSGSGLSLHWTPLAHLAAAVGAGYSVHGPRIGVQVRGELLSRQATPYIGLGLAYDFGVNTTTFSSTGVATTIGSGETAVTGISDTQSTESTVGAGLDVQLVGGVSYLSEGGLFVLSAAGYAFAQGKADDTFFLDGFKGPLGDFFSGSGPVMGIALGYAF